MRGRKTGGKVKVDKQGELEKALKDFKTCTKMSNAQVTRYLERKGFSVSEASIAKYANGSFSTPKFKTVIALLEEEPRYAAFKAELLEARRIKPEYKLMEVDPVMPEPKSYEVPESVESAMILPEREPEKVLEVREAESPLEREVMKLGLIELARKLGLSIEVK